MIAVAFAALMSALSIVWQFLRMSVALFYRLACKLVRETNAEMSCKAQFENSRAHGLNICFNVGQMRATTPSANCS